MDILNVNRFDNKEVVRIHGTRVGSYQLFQELAM